MPLPLETPDARYLIVRDRLWRKPDPRLPLRRRLALVGELLRAQRELGEAKREGNWEIEQLAEDQVDEFKQALGERGAPWWTDGAPDQHSVPVQRSTYASWYAARQGID
jgi:hypothetical protein